MRLGLSLFLILLFSYSVCAKKQTKRENWKVTYIVDGDTFYAEQENENRTKFRLIGVDTPESKYPDKPIEAFSKEAIYRLTELIADSLVLIEYDIQKIDRYGRSLAYVYTPKGVFVNQDLVENGLARVYTVPPNIKYVELFLEAQSIARKDKKGLWE